MSRIFCLMGKSSSGKDTIYKELLLDEELNFHKIIPYTTRPVRAGEKDGVEYFFSSEEQLEKLIEEKKVIELRCYDTVLGIWKYFTVDDGQIQLKKNNYLIIGTLESYLKVRDYFGKENVVPIYIEVDDGVRLQRALDREKKEHNPKYAEMCRRFLADAEDFSEENLIAGGIEKRFLNNDLEATVQEVKEYCIWQSR